MRHAALLLLALSSIACNADFIPVYVEWRGPGEAQPLLDEAGDILGYDVVQVDDKYGALWLSVHEVAPGWCIWGDTIDPYGCERAAWVHTNASALAHEMGHMMGLQHSTDPDDVMYPRANPGYLTDKERRKFERSLGRLNACE